MSSSETPTDARSKSKKPANTRFKQQRLPAWQPVMTARTVIPTFFILGVICVPLGAVFYTTSQNVKEKIIDYTYEDACKNCHDTLNTTGAHEPGYIKCTCNITFALDTPFEGDVYMYYGLDNFYQNHRRYVKSRDDNQLRGNEIPLNGLDDDCSPYKTIGDKQIAPCGAIANSLFNDTLTLTYEDTTPVPLNNTGIAWKTDKGAKFRNPPHDPGSLCNATGFKNTVKPPNWPVHVCNLDPNNEDNSGYLNEDLIVWMRNAALPNFRKLYRIVNKEGIFTDGLPAGNYTLDIVYNYPVKDFGGRKKMILSTVSWLGGKNPFLGIAYMAVGVICVILGIIFFIIHYRIGQSAEEAANVTPTTNYM
ncbi:cell cycle control protein 50A-like [Watersipora subatra]|uniref:cell cycle control protein 50A-like n=1 Tax=Watersipora subatra TaxID=2589382 RepID=UPI00355AE87A